MESLTSRLIRLSFVLFLSGWVSVRGADVDESVSLPLSSDSLVRIVAENLELPMVDWADLPVFGTYWVFHGKVPQVPAPLPCPPMDPSLPVYAITSDGRQFLVDGGGSPSTLDPTKVAAQIERLLSLIDKIQEAEARREMFALGGMEMLLLDEELDTLQFGYSTNELWIEVSSVTTTNAGLVVHPPWSVTDGVYDIFSATNLALPLWQGVARCAPGQTNMFLTNAVSPAQFYIAGITNDTDAGGITDAHEGLLGLNKNDPADDWLVPQLSVAVTDSVAIEQYPTNTAALVITRRGGHVNLPLTVYLTVTGNANLQENYNLSPVTVTSSNVLAVIPMGATNLTLSLVPIDNQVIEGSKTVTLTLQADPAWEILAGHGSATAWILEEYAKSFTTVEDFRRGVSLGLDAVEPSPNGQLQFRTNLPAQFPFINVACSGRDTMVRINTTNGQVMGEYRTVPYRAGLGQYASPSRTTVDQYGNVWLANRYDSFPINGTNQGSITRIGLIVGPRYSRNGTNYFPDANGQYISVSEASYNTCMDRDGDGYIRTSRGLADILPWSNVRDGIYGVDTEGGVSTAEDESITGFVRVPCTGTRTIAVDKFNDVWVGGDELTRVHLKVDGLLGLPVPGSAFSPNAGGYGGVIDSLGALWSSPGSGGPGSLLRLRPFSGFPIRTNDWEALQPEGFNTQMYGIAVDPAHPQIWMSTATAGVLFRWHTNGTVMTNLDGTVRTSAHGPAGTHAQGLAVDGKGHVWVAHAKTGSTVGHLNTNGTWLGNVRLNSSGLWAEYFAGTNLAVMPVTADLMSDAPLNFDSQSGWPEPPVPSAFSARWSGILNAETDGDHAFRVRAEAGAAVRLIVAGRVLIDNWANPGSEAIDLWGTNWLGTDVSRDIKLEYAHFGNGARVSLEWVRPGAEEPEIISYDAFRSYSFGATGVSVDAAGRIWAGCYGSSTAVRIDPDAGPMVIDGDGRTNHVGLVDMVADLGDGSGHPEPYAVEAQPYNYSDMTGFNVRVVNPGLQPLRGYWMVVNDSGNDGQLWNKVSWTESVTNGCAVNVFIRVAETRGALEDETFISVTNDTVFPTMRGRYMEVRLAMTRDDASKEPVVYDLTLHGISSSFAGYDFLFGGWADEGGDASFWTELAGPEPVGYTWYRIWPWETNWVQVAGATNSYLAITNVDSWVDGYLDEYGDFHGTQVACLVTNGSGESRWLGPEYLVVDPVGVQIPPTNYITFEGPASRYPLAINVFGQPTNFNRVSVTVMLRGLFHTRSADISILLVSPLGKEVMLMSSVGGTNSVSNGTLIFQDYWTQPEQSEPLQTPGPSPWPRYLGPSNYGQIQQMPQIGPDPPPDHEAIYSVNLYDLEHDDPNGAWNLYIYDNAQGMKGHLDSSWQLGLKFE